MCTNHKDGEHWMGNDTLKVPMELFAENRRRLVAALRSKTTEGTAVLLQGGDEVSLYDTDVTVSPFRQESYFFWAFGVTEPQFYGLIDIDTGRSVLFIPRFPPEYAVWMGKIFTTDYFKTKYAVDEVAYNDNIIATLTTLGTTTLLLLEGKNTDSDLVATPANFKGMESRYVVDKTILFPIISELRVFKTDRELDVLRYVCRLSSDAHKAVMTTIRPNMYEYQLESVFQNHCYFAGGCRYVGYTCICGSGENSAILHYGHGARPNDKQIHDGDMCLFDMGGEYFCYTADITCSFPANGKFTERQKGIYEAVLAANRSVHDTAKPGESWVNMHLLAERTLLTSLLHLGLVRGSIDGMMTERIGALFMPHGLGHFMGLAVHDVNGFYDPATGKYTERLKGAGLKSLRTNRILQPRMVLTIEPGCYFIEELLRPAFDDERKKQYLVKEVIETYLHEQFGGIRIEDNVVVTETGVEDMTRVPRSVAEIETWMGQRSNKS